MLYAAFWGLLQSEDNALLLRGVLLFTFFSILMITERKLNSYEIERENDSDKKCQKVTSVRER